MLSRSEEKKRRKLFVVWGMFFLHLQPQLNSMSRCFRSTKYTLTQQQTCTSNINTKQTKGKLKQNVQSGIDSGTAVNNKEEEEKEKKEHYMYSGVDNG